MRGALVMASLLFTGCSTDEEQRLAAVEPPELAGEYRVAGVDGGGIDLPHGITASISEQRIDVQSDCIRFAWTYSYDGERLATTSVPVPSCRRALLPEEQAIQTAFDAAETVTRTPSNGVEFSGEGHRVTLFSQ